MTFPLIAHRAARRWAAGVRAVSFDEIIVTTFTAGAGYQTLPLWFADNFSRPNAIPVVNVGRDLVVLAVDHPGLHRASV